MWHGLFGIPFQQIERTVRPQIGSQQAIDGAPAERVAKTLGMTAGAVYAAKARTMRKLVERIRTLEAEWSIDPSTPGEHDGGAP